VKKFSIVFMMFLLSLLLVACAEDREPPVIEGVEDEQILQGETFDPMEGVSATDHDGNDITDRIEVDGFVNSQILGEHNLTYTVTDEEGLSTTVNRYITVVFETDEPHEIFNGDFSLGTGGWTFDQPGGTASWSVDDEILSVDIESPGNEWWQLQIYQLIEITEGQTYRIDVIARATENKTLGLGLEDTTAGYAMIPGGTHAIELDSEFDTYSFYFTSDRSIDAAKFVFYLGQMGIHEETAIVDIDTVSVTPVEFDESELTIDVETMTYLLVNDPFDALEGVTASLDGDDVTDLIEVRGVVNTNVANRTPYVVQYVVETADHKTFVNRVVDVELGAAPDRLYNSEFEQGITGWTVDFPEGEGTMSVVDGILEAQLDNLGSAWWHIQLSQNERTIEEGVTYRVSFRAKADDPKVVGLGVENPADDFASLIPTAPEWTLTDEYETYTYEFTAEETITTVKYALFLGMMSADDVPTTVYVDHFMVTTVVETGTSVIQNPDMTEEEGWNFDFPEGEGTMHYEDDTLIAAITDVGDYWWHIQLQQDGIQVEAGTSYLVSITLSSSETRVIGIGLEDANEGFANVAGEDIHFEATPEMQTFYYLFTPDEAYSNLKLALFLGRMNDSPESTVTVEQFDMTVADDQNILENSTFEDESHWEFDFPEGEGTMTVENNQLLAELTDIGDAWWHVQLAQLNASIESGASYLVTFRISSDEPRRIGLGIEDPADGFRDLKGDVPVEWDIDETMRTYSFVFNAEDTIDTAKFALFFGWHTDGDAPSNIVVEDFFVIRLAD